MAFIKREFVLCAAVLAAVVSAFFVPPSAEYIGYIDFKVLALLFCLMLAVAGAGKTGVFQIITRSLVSRARGQRSLVMILSAACFFVSMLITNDVALITLVPLALLIFTPSSPAAIPAVISMTVAANLGSMLTPVGNPQNLYLYTLFGMGTGEFFLTMLPPVCLSAVMIVVYDFTVKPAAAGVAGGVIPEEREKTQTEEENHCSLKSIAPWAAMFAICILSVLRVLDWRIMLAICVAATLVLDRSLFKKVDYSLLITFAAFFVFVGNIRQLPQISLMLSSVVQGHEFAAGAMLSQVISNVPAAMLLSGFTGDARALLLGVDVGGLGTPVASMASLISYKLYASCSGAKRGRFMGVFLLVNFVMLAVLSAACRAFFL
ncbi:MAG: citrate transporter [Oscillospiraceae bacterium]|nr:citrate transporter [Oscillospiraceae bacterium]